jgi:hypothetical protein
MIRPSSRRTLIAALVIIAALCLVSQHALAQISSVKVGANYSHYRGPCPAHLRFAGNIYVDHAPLTYNYQWERSDGAKTEKHVVHVQNPGERHLTIFEEWNLGAPGASKEVWQRLRVRTGNTDVTSDSANVVVECR